MAVTDISAAQRPNPVAAHPAAIGGHDDGSTAEAASAPGSRIVTARRATALLSVLAVMAVAAFGYEQAQGRLAPVPPPVASLRAKKAAVSRRGGRADSAADTHCTI